MMIRVELSERDLRGLVWDHLRSMLGDDVVFDVSDVKIQVKSKQNYKSEWEEASFRAVLNLVR